MNIWQKRGMKSFCFFLLIILLIRKCGLLKKDEIIEDKEKNSVTLSKIDNVNIEDNTKKLNSDYLVTKKSQKNKKIVAVEEIIEDKQEVKVDIKETDIEEDIQEKNNKFIEPVIIEEMDILFEQGYKYVEENKADEVGKILASIDPITVKPKLNVIGDREFGKNTLSFYVYSNYLVYLDSGEIEIYGDSQGREKLATLILDEIKLKKKYEITLSDGYKNLKKVYYKLIVRDKNNKKDETEIKELDLTLKTEGNLEQEEQLIEKIYDTSSLKIHQIPIDFYKIRFYGKGFKENNKILLDGQEITVDTTGNFVYEEYYFPGEYNFEFKVYEVEEYEIEEKKIVRTAEDIQNEDTSEDLKILEKIEKESEKSNVEIEEQEYYTEDGVYVLIKDGKRREEKYLYTYPVDMKIDENYYFLVGIADVKIGRNKVEKSSELLLKNSEYDEGMFNDGRLAFYTRNRIGKYSVVAQMDTDNQDLLHIFDGMGKRDNRDIFKDMENEDSGYTFGDDSHSMMDVDTQGQFYLRVEWDKNKALWGNYSSAVDNGEYLSYSKSLYGAFFQTAGQDTTSYNEDRYSGTIFFSNPETLSEYNIFLATGGSLYYLNNKDLVEGSESVTIEVINQRTGQKVKEVSLSEGEDYSINNIQGRIILNEPLYQYGYKELGDVIKDSPLSDYKTYLKVQYEYYERGVVSTADYTTGGNAKYWISDNIQLGGAYVKSTELEEEYELKGINGVIRKTENTYLEWEYAQSKGRKIGRGAYSSTGGLSFTDINYIDKDEDDDENLDNQGSAYRLKGVLSLNELSKKFTEGSMAEFWYDKKESGFSVDSLDDGSTDTEYGFTTDYRINDRLVLTTEFSRIESKDEDSKSEEQELSLQATYAATDKMSVAVAIRHDKNDDGSDESSSSDSESSGSSGSIFDDDYESDENGDSVDVGVTVSYQFTENTSGYVGVQKAISTDKVDANDVMGSVGVSTKLFDKIKLDIDYSPGDTESGLAVQTSYNVTENYETYVSYERESSNDGVNDDIGFGQKVLIGEKYEIYQENQLSKDRDSGEELTQVYGLNINLTEELKVGIGYEQGDLDEEDGKSRRNSISTNLYYDDRKRWKYNNRLELIKDKGDEEHTEEWLTVNDLKFKYNEEWTMVAKLDYSITKDKYNGGYDNKFMEFGIGGAYRPIWNDRLNMLWKYTYLYDLTGHEEDEDYSFGDLDERSNIFSFDAIYSLTKKIDIGGKWAYKKAEMKAANDEDEWYNASTTMYAVSMSYNFYKNWRVSGEYHWLISDSDNERKEGVMAGIDYDVHKNLRIGIGYNFTDFSDDLRYDDYNASGIYINIIGRF